MKNKTQELIETLKNNPDRELIFLYPEDGSDNYYTLGYSSKIVIDEYYVENDHQRGKQECVIKVHIK